MILHDQIAPGRKLGEPRQNTTSNRLELADRPVHDWYRFVLSYPPHLVRDYVNRFALHTDACVLDPFCGTGTTPVECKKLGLQSLGIEAHPMSHFASATKLDWTINPDQLEATAVAIAERTLSRLEQNGIIDDPQPNLLRETSPCALLHLPESELDLLLKDSISPLPLHKTLTLLKELDQQPYGAAHLRLALAKALGVHCFVPALP